MSCRFSQDPDAILDYRIDWSQWLDGDAISASTWQVDEGLTIGNSPPPAHTPTTTTVWLSGGISGAYYRATNHIVTEAGREDDRSFTLYINER